jgi:hypothetical protein
MQLGVLQVNGYFQKSVKEVETKGCAPPIQQALSPASQE